MAFYIFDLEKANCDVYSSTEIYSEAFTPITFHFLKLIRILFFVKAIVVMGIQ